MPRMTLEELGVTNLASRQTDDEVLRGGIKHMLSLAAKALIPAAEYSAISGEDPSGDFFGEVEDAVVDHFIDGLRHNGYDIVKTEA